MSSLPEEIYLNILWRLPVKSILVCKSVSKSWYSLISDHDFVKMHLDLTTQKNNYSIIFKYDKSYRLYSRNDDAVVFELETPYKYLTKSNTNLLGSCNGLVYGWNSQMRFFFLWNPATKEYKRLPKSDTNDRYVCGHHGFRYDYKTDDYKLVRIDGKNKGSLVQIYSLRSNSWKQSQFIPYVFPCMEVFGVLFNGALHWFEVFKGKGSSRMIVSMDITEETFGELQPPAILPDQYFMSIGVLEECLCVLVENKETFEVWVMRDYGVPDSWTKLYTITYESIFGDNLHSWSYAVIIGSSKNGEILFMARSMVVSYDSRYETAINTEIDHVERGVAVKYSESLVSLTFNTVVGRRKKRDNTTKKRNR